MPITVADVAQLSGLPTHTVRWYLRRGLLRPRRNVRNRYYEFTARDLSALNFIRRAKALGFTLREIATIFEVSHRRESPCPTVRDIVRRRVVDFAIEVNDLAATQRYMRRALRLWRGMPNAVPKGDEICRLIEAVGGPVDVGLAHESKIGRGSAAKRRRR